MYTHTHAHTDANARRTPVIGWKSGQHSAAGGRAPHEREPSEITGYLSFVLLTRRGVKTMRDKYIFFLIPPPLPDKDPLISSLKYKIIKTRDDKKITCTKNSGIAKSTIYISITMFCCFRKSVNKIF